MWREPCTLATASSSLVVMNCLQDDSKWEGKNEKMIFRATSFYAANGTKCLSINVLLFGKVFTIHMYIHTFIENTNWGFLVNKLDYGHNKISPIICLCSLKIIDNFFLFS